MVLSILVFTLLFLSQAWSGAATAQLELEPSQLAVGEAATLTLRLEGASPRGGHPGIAAPSGLRITPTGQSSQVSIVNGRQSVQLSLVYSLEALREGTYTLPAVSIQTDAGLLRTKPLQVKVTATPANAPGDGQPNLQLAVSKTNVVSGEVFGVEAQLFVEEGRLLQDPQFESDGFILSKMAPPAQTRRRMNGRVINVVNFRLAAHAVKTGVLKLGPVTLQMEVPRPGTRPDFFFGRPSQKVRLSSEPVEITVQPLPPGAPPEFTGSVGQFDLNYTAGPQSLAVGDPITLKVSISGSGPADSIRLPDLAGWKGFKFYEPTTRTEMADALEVTGTRHFEQVVVPQSPEIRELPEFRWSYFDPDQNQYRTLVGKSIPLQVAASAAPTLPMPSLTPATNSSTGSTAPSLIHIRPTLGSAITTPMPLWQNPLLLALQLIPVGLWGVFKWRRVRLESLDRNPRLRRRLEVDRVVAGGLRDLNRLAAEQKSGEFFELLMRVLRSRIGERLDIPDTGITEAVIEDHLRRRGLPAEDLQRLEELFRQNNQFRFAGQLPPQGLTGLVRDVEQVLKGLEALSDASDRGPA